MKHNIVELVSRVVGKMSKSGPTVKESRRADPRAYSHEDRDAEDEDLKESESAESGDETEDDDNLGRAVKMNCGEADDDPVKLAGPAGSGTPIHATQVSVVNHKTGKPEMGHTVGSASKLTGHSARDINAAISNGRPYKTDSFTISPHPSASVGGKPAGPSMNKPGELFTSRYLQPQAPEPEPEIGLEPTAGERAQARIGKVFPKPARGLDALQTIPAPVRPPARPSPSEAPTQVYRKKV